MAEPTLHAMLAERVAVGADRTAFLFEGEAISSARLEQRSRRLASGLAAAGIGPGNRIAYLGRNSAACYEILFTASRIGAVMMPVNRRLAGKEIACIPLCSSRPVASSWILNRPYQAIVDFGRITRMPVVQPDDSIAIVPQRGASLTVDHRGNDGAAAGTLLTALVAGLEQLEAGVV